MSTEQKPGGKPNTVIIVISLVGLILLAGVVLSAIRWVLGIVVLAGIGYGIWYFVGPKLTGFIQRRREGKVRRQADKQAKNAEQTREQNIERALDEIKRDMKQG